MLLVVALSGFLVEHMRDLGRQTTARVMLLGLIPTIIVMAEPDLGSATVYVAGTLALLFVAGAPWRRCSRSRPRWCWWPLRGWACRFSSPTRRTA